MIAGIGAARRSAPRVPAARRSLIPLLVSLVAFATAACGGAGGGADGASGGGSAARGRALGGCLGPFCLGQSIADAEQPEQAAAITSGRPPTGVTCWRFEKTDVAAFADAGGDEALVRGVLATALPFCGGHPALASATTPDIVDCRGVRLGDAAAFVTKVHRQARPIEPDADLWPEAPEGVTGLADICAAGGGSAHRTTLYLKDDRVVGIGIGRR